MTLYLETYTARVSDTYTTRRGKTIAVAHFWRFFAERYPEVTSPALVRPLHLRELTDLRTFFSDLCTWALEPDAPFRDFAPPTVPLTRHSLLGLGFDKARERTRARITATVLDLEREMPAIRSFAPRRWNDATARMASLPASSKPWTQETDSFWDWALLELPW